jgi:hypothetical protein
MGKFLIGVFVGALLLYGLYRHQPAASPADTAALEREDPPQVEIDTTTSSTSARRCDGRQYCSQMTSCDEATWFLQNCPGMKMDGEGDGVPCEKQWCGHQ